MSLFQRKPKNSIKARAEPGASPPANGYWVPVTRVRADMTMSLNEAIYAASSRISNTFACMPLHLYKGNILQTDHPLELLMARKPSANFTPFCFRQTMEAFRNTEGNAYALIVPDKLGTAKRLDILNPTRVRPQKHPETGELWYVVQLDDNKLYPVPWSMILTVRYMSANGVIGVRPVDVLRSSLEYDRETKALSLDQLDGVNQGVMLDIPNTGLDGPKKDALVQSFLDTYEKSNRSVIVLEGGMKATTFNQSAVDPKLLDVERITRNRVATVYNIPPHLLGDYTDTSFSTAEQQMQEFLQLTILPIAVQWEDELNRKLLTDADIRSGYTFRFDTDALARADTATMAEKNQKAIRGGWGTVNEARKRDGLPKVEGGDTLLISRDLLPLSYVLANPEKVLGAKTDPEKDDPAKGGTTK